MSSAVLTLSKTVGCSSTSPCVIFSSSQSYYLHLCFSLPIFHLVVLALSIPQSVLSPPLVSLCRPLVVAAVLCWDGGQHWTSWSLSRGSEWCLVRQQGDFPLSWITSTLLILVWLFITPRPRDRGLIYLLGASHLSHGPYLLCDIEVIELQPAVLITRFWAVCRSASQQGKVQVLGHSQLASDRDCLYGKCSAEWEKVKDPLQDYCVSERWGARPTVHTVQDVICLITDNESPSSFCITCCTVVFLNPLCMQAMFCLCSSCLNSFSVVCVSAIIPSRLFSMLSGTE